MSEKDLSKSVLDKIEQEQVKPKPKWQFLLHEWLLWGLGGISVFIGGLAMSIIFVQVRLIDWDLFDILGGGVLQVIPYLWLVLLAGFILLAHYQIKHTKKGYQYSVSAVVFLLVSLSLLLGSLFYHFRIGFNVHTHLSGRSDIYRSIADRRASLWNNPDEGRLGGVLLEQISEDELLLLDTNGAVWTVMHDGVPLPNGPASRGIPEEAKLRILGAQVSESEFTAEEILPWIPPQNPFEKGHRKKSATKSSGLRTR